METGITESSDFCYKTKNEMKSKMIKEMGSRDFIFKNEIDNRLVLC